jgi:hypothetical protein
MLARDAKGAASAESSRRSNQIFQRNLKKVLTSASGFDSIDRLRLIHKKSEAQKLKDGQTESIEEI